MKKSVVFFRRGFFFFFFLRLLSLSVGCSSSDKVRWGLSGGKGKEKLKGKQVREGVKEFNDAVLMCTAFFWLYLCHHSDN